jgi:hypothetical protein
VQCETRSGMTTLQEADIETSGGRGGMVEGEEKEGGGHENAIRSRICTIASSRKRLAAWIVRCTMSLGKGSTAFATIPFVEGGWQRPLPLQSKNQDDQIFKPDGTTSSNNKDEKPENRVDHSGADFGQEVNKAPA